MSGSRRSRGQGLLEFALILPALLMIVLSIIEGALLFQSYLAIQHAAREAARYAAIYQPPITYSVPQGKIIQEGGDPGAPAVPNETEAQWYIRRVGLIKQRALDQAMGIRILQPVISSPESASFDGLSSSPGFFGVRVWGFPAYDQGEELDHPGLQGLPVRVRISYRWQPLDPLLGAIMPNGILIHGEAVMINEGVQAGLGAVAPPTFAPPPTIDAPTVLPTQAGGTATYTPTPTFTPTPTQAPPTATPTGAYIILLDSGDQERSPWLQADLPNSRAQLHQHNPGTYQLYWTDNCGTRTPLGINVNVPSYGATPVADMPDTFDYLSDGCGGIREDETYACEISSCPVSGPCASNQVDVYVPITRPDLVVTRFLYEGGDLATASDVPSGVPIVIQVEILNDGDRVVTGTFDVDIYIDPPDPNQVLKQLPGMGTASGDQPKKWYASNMAPGDTALLNYVVMLYSGDEHIAMAQVDTSDMIEEGDEENNISDPVTFVAQCSDRCDDFNDGTLDGWDLSIVGGSGAGSPSIVSERLRIEGTAMYLYNQGSYDGNFELTVKVTDYPRGAEGAMAGVMVIESLDPTARYVAAAVVSSGGAAHFGAYARESVGADPTTLCGDTQEIPVFGDGVWVRIVREGDVFTAYVSTDGDEFITMGCLEVTLSGFADPSYPGILMSPGG